MDDVFDELEIEGAPQEEELVVEEPPVKATEPEPASKPEEPQKKRRVTDRISTLTQIINRQTDELYAMNKRLEDEQKARRELEKVSANVTSDHMTAQLEQLEKLYEQALENADQKGAAKLVRDMASLSARAQSVEQIKARVEKDPEPEPEPKKAPVPVPAQVWMVDRGYNEWDAEQQGIAEVIATRLRKNGSDPSTESFYTELDSALKKRLPELYKEDEPEEVLPEEKKPLIINTEKGKVATPARGIVRDGNKLKVSPEVKARIKAGMEMIGWDPNDKDQVRNYIKFNPEIVG